MLTKSHARTLFGGRYQSVASAVGVTKSAVSQWPEVLPQPIEDRVVGAAIRRGIPIADIFPQKDAHDLEEEQS